MKLFQRVASVLPGTKKGAGGSAVEEEEDMGGFGPPGGVLWTTPIDVMTDRPKSAAIPASDHPAPVTAAPIYAEPAPAPAPAPAAYEPLPEPLLPVLSELGAFGLMSTNIAATSQIQGFIGSCLVDSESGLLLASEGGEGLDMEAEAALNTMVVKAETEVIEVLDLEDHIEDILITMTKQLHFIRPLEKAPGVFLYVALDKKAANLGMARMQVKRVEAGLSI
jgi:predicted regulator of Ras-like GTPase activity (Roadblock/LC7/MglB family)